MSEKPKTKDPLERVPLTPEQVKKIMKSGASGNSFNLANTTISDDVRIKAQNLI